MNVCVVPFAALQHG